MDTLARQEHACNQKLPLSKSFHRLQVEDVAQIKAVSFISRSISKVCIFLPQKLKLEVDLASII